MDSFVFESLPARVVFGAGARHRVAEEMDRLGHRRAVVLSTPGQADMAGELATELGDLVAGVFDEAAMHTPVDVTERAMRAVADLGADCTVAIGGGSAIGLGKAIAARSGLDQIALPTTYAGSEVTPVLGETVDRVKTTRRTLTVLPEVVIYDVDLTLTMPVGLTVTSAVNSLAHAVEALWAKERNPVISLMAREAVTVFLSSLPAIVADPFDRAARGRAQYAAWLSGTCLGTVGMALHHKLCHVLGGTFGLPHAPTHAVMLPYVIAFNAGAAPGAVAAIEESAGGAAVPSLRGLLRGLGAPVSLRELGLPEPGIVETAGQCLNSPYWNPRAVRRGPLLRLLRDAWAGDEPPPDGYPDDAPRTGAATGPGLAGR